jgi:hypothetical protein
MLDAKELWVSRPVDEFAWSLAQRSAIQTEVNDILAHPAFKNSRRCVALFRHLIEYALDNDCDSVKERTLGIEVFGRNTDYDTNTDPIVRMTANEIRKRLAQYYQESTRAHEVKIRLVPGTYRPRFDFDARELAAAADEGDIPQAAPGMVPFSDPAALLGISVDEPVRNHPWWRWGPLIAFGLSAVAIAVALTYGYAFRSTQDLLWAPILESNESVIVCVADINSLELHRADWAQEIAATIANHRLPQRSMLQTEPPVVPFVDTDVAARMTGWMSAHHKQSSSHPSSALTLEDLRRGPVVLIGAFDNPWTLVLLSNLRYRVKLDPATQDEWVEDAQNPSRHDWQGTGKLLYSDSSIDYAIVTRILDPDTGKWILAAGGLGMHGTEAAGELLTDPAFAKTLPPFLRSNKKNFQVVLKTRVIDGHTGPPQIVAAYTW